MYYPRVFKKNTTEIEIKKDRRNNNKRGINIEHGISMTNTAGIDIPKTTWIDIKTKQG